MLRWLASRLRGTAADTTAAARAAGTAYALQGRYAEAIVQLQRAFDAEPQDAATANLLGVCYTLALRFADAERCYMAAIARDPSMRHAYGNAGWNAFLSRPADAGRYFREWIARSEPAPAAPRDGLPPLKLGAVTLCCIDCSYHDLAARALRHTLARCEFADALFFSDRDCDVRGVRWVGIDPVRSAADYSNFMIHELHRHVETDHALVVQYDGFVLNAAAWDAAFLAYDYVGAKIPVGDRFLVGNGGFSLRSKKLLRALHTDEEVRRYDARSHPYQEDLAICHAYRERLETRHGIRIAPESLADRFAVEHTSPNAGCFGFHNIVHLAGLYETGFCTPVHEVECVVATFNAETELGPLVERRELEVRGNDAFWNARRPSA